MGQRSNVKSLTNVKTIWLTYTGWPSLTNTTLETTDQILWRKVKAAHLDLFSHHLFVCTPMQIRFFSPHHYTVKRGRDNFVFWKKSCFYLPKMNKMITLSLSARGSYLFALVSSPMSIFGAFLWWEWMLVRTYLWAFASYYNNLMNRYICISPITLTSFHLSDSGLTRPDLQFNQLFCCGFLSQTLRNLSPLSLFLP